MRDPSNACARLIGTTPITSRPSRRKQRSGATSITTMGPPCPLGPWFLSRRRAPSSTPAGTSTVMRFSMRTSPLPWHVGQRCEGTVPFPRHTGQGRLTAKPPCPNDTVPRPLHSGHVLTVAPLAAPVPPQVGQTSGIAKVIGTDPPSAATRNGIVTLVSTSSGSASRPAPRRPKIEEKRSPRPPKSDISKSPLSGAPRPPPPGVSRRPRELALPAPANAPYRRSVSYFFRFSGSLNTSCASLISLKRSAACGLLGLRSGWYCFASRRNAFLISSVLADSATPNNW